MKELKDFLSQDDLHFMRWFKIGFVAVLIIVVGIWAMRLELSL